MIIGTEVGEIEKNNTAKDRIVNCRKNGIGRERKKGCASIQKGISIPVPTPGMRRLLRSGL